MRISKELFCFGMLALSAVSPAQAALTVSSARTANVTCAEAVCTATAAHAVLNVDHLRNMLANKNPKLVSGSVAGDIVIVAPLSWPGRHTLTLDAYHSVIVNQPVTVEGTGGLSVITNDGGSGGIFSFDVNGYVTFWDLSSKLTINGASYTLVGDIPSLVSDVSANQNGYFALAASHDASTNGTYGSSPVAAFGGAFEGLGNTIYNLTITNPGKAQYTGLFGQLASSATVENLTLANAQVTNGPSGATGALVGVNFGQLSGISVSGSIVGGYNGYTGAIAGGNYGTIVNSHATATVRGCCNAGGLVGGNAGTLRNSNASGNVTGAVIAGGLVGLNTGFVDMSYATGVVEGKIIGGLVGENNNSITNSYASGRVLSTQASADVGGLVGLDQGNTIANCYSAAYVKGPNLTGGLIGDDTQFGSPGSASNTYWDFTTSGLANSGFGAGNIPNISGITAMTTVQLQSGLPTGFDPSIWAESPSINGGLPYLIGNPPL
jgi:hypothetical protein